MLAMHANIGIGLATTAGFSWTYHVFHPDIKPPNGKIYYTLTKDGEELNADDVDIPKLDEPQFCLPIFFLRFGMVKVYLEILQVMRLKKMKIYID